MRFDEQFIHQVLPEASIIGSVSADSFFVVDSRVVKEGDIFIALRGKNHDGHSFVPDAFKRGARGALISREKEDMCVRQLHDLKLNPRFLLIVANPLHALIALATAWREQFQCPVIGVTGSIGKTSTKEAIAMLLKEAGKSFIASKGNQNTQIGVSLNILRMRSYHEAAIFEMGVNRRGEMAMLARIVKPTIGVITSIGHCHMEGLGSLTDIAVEKRDIFKYFSEKNIGIINGDQSIISQVSFMHPVIKFGYKTTNQIQARKVHVGKETVRCTVKIYKKKYEVVLPKPHTGTVNGALVVASIGHIFNIDHATIIQAIQKSIIVTGRFEKRRFKKGNGVIINDCYNANPESMKAALLAFQNINTSATKIAILGDMHELGINSQFWHRQIGRFLRKVSSLKQLLLVGNMVEWTEKTLPMGMNVVRVKTWQEAKKILPQMINNKEALVLVKGSNGTGLLNLVDHFTL